MNDKNGKEEFWPKELLMHCELAKWSKRPHNSFGKGNGLLLRVMVCFRVGVSVQVEHVFKISL
jgi:hypothetical protein